MTAESESLVIPPDYTFAPIDLLIHKDSYERVMKLFEQANNRNPDVHHMYIYNDYFGYAILDLVDSTLSTIHTYFIKKRWHDTWRALVALTRFNDNFGDWTQIGDGERCRVTEKVYGALLVSTIRALDAAGQFSETAIPDLASCLGTMVGWATMWSKMSNCCYHQVLQAYGKKLFGTRTDEEWEHIADVHEKACKAYIETLSPEEREKRGFNKCLREQDDEDEDDEDENDSKPWYDDGDIQDIGMKDSSLRVTPTWKAYKDYLRECPRLPLCGPPTWDLTDWTDEEKKPFSFDNYN